MSEHDTIRWGDTQNLVVPVGFSGSFGGEGGALPLVTKQMVSTRWRWPLTWTVLIVLQPAFNADETATFQVQALFTVGCGSAVVTYPKVYTFAPTGGVYTLQTDQLFLPAKDLQIIAAFGTSGAAASAKSESMLVGILAAPNSSEPHAATELLEHVTKEHHPEQGTHPQWMQGAFVPEHLRYR